MSTGAEDRWESRYLPPECLLTGGLHLPICPDGCSLEILANGGTQPLLGEGCVLLSTLRDEQVYLRVVLHHCGSYSVRTRFPSFGLRVTRPMRLQSRGASVHLSGCLARAIS